MMYNIFNSCFSSSKIEPKLSLHQHMLLYIRNNHFIISSENTYTVTLIMNECIRYIDEIHHNKSSSVKYSIAIQCMYDILQNKLLDLEFKKMMNLIKACVYVHYDK